MVFIAKFLSGRIVPHALPSSLRAAGNFYCHLRKHCHLRGYDARGVSLRFLPLLFLAMTLMSGPAHAACLTPAGDAGKVIYNADHSMMQYCDGTNWVAMGGVSPVEGDVATGLNAHWKLDESSGTTAADSSGNGFNGTLVNMDGGTDWAPGKMNNALDFDGIDDAVNSGYAPGMSYNDGEWTISGWFRSNSTRAGNHTIVGARNGAAGARFRINYTQSCSCINVSMADTGSGAGGTSFSAPAMALFDGQWHHVSVTVKHKEYLRIYVDGVLVYTSADMSGNSQVNGSMNISEYGIGAFYSGGVFQDFFEGQLDEIRHYTRRLSGEDVAKLYCVESRGKIFYDLDSRVMRFCTAQGVGVMGSAGPIPPGDSITSGLTGHWKLDEGAGLTAADSSGFGYDGTLTNGPIWINGKIGNALDFDGVNDHVLRTSYNPAALNYVPAISGCAWFYSDVNQNRYVAFWNRSADGGLIFKPVSLTGSSGKINVAVRLIGGIVTLETPNMGAGYWNGKWHHVCTVFDKNLASGRLKIYVNGEIAAQDDALDATLDQNNALNLGSLNIGRDPFNGTYFDGKIDDVRIYNRALSANEVRIIHTMSACSGPVAPQGEMIYNTDHAIMQYCNGTDWIGIGKSP